MNTGSAEPQVIGNADFIHLEQDNGVWWLVDRSGKRCITTGMNHVGEEGVLFNEVIQGWLTEKFGADIPGSRGGLNPRAKNHGGYADMVVKDSKITLSTPFHSMLTRHRWTFTRTGRSTMSPRSRFKAFHWCR